MIATRNSKWFLVTRPKPNARFRMFCVPYAGGSATAYMGWEALVPPDIELVSIQFPGRANRLAEALIPSVHELADQLGAAIASWLDRPYVLYGHSLGSAVAFELLHVLQARQHPLPRRFICAARRAPHLLPRLAPIHDYPLERFKAELKSLNGTPEAILNSPDLMEIFVPILRTDFKAAYSYFREPHVRLPCDASIFCGARDDKVLPQDMRAWCEHFSGEIDFRVFDGGHFFLDENGASVVSAICHGVGLNRLN